MENMPPISVPPRLHASVCVILLPFRIRYQATATQPGG